MKKETYKELEKLAKDFKLNLKGCEVVDVDRIEVQMETDPIKAIALSEVLDTLITELNKSKKTFDYTIMARSNDSYKFGIKSTKFIPYKDCKKTFKISVWTTIKIF